MVIDNIPFREYIFSVFISAYVIYRDLETYFNKDLGGLNSFTKRFFVFSFFF